MQLTQQQEAQLAPLLKLYQNDIAAFVVDLWGDEQALRPKQLEFCNAFRDNKRITFKGGVGFGKTRSLAILIWWALVTFADVQVTVFGPTEANLRDNVWKELKNLHDKMDAAWKSQFDMNSFRAWSIGKETSCFASYRLVNKDNTAAARGIHQINNFVFVDEADGVDDIIYTDALTNILSDPNPKLCLISNPSKNSGYFWETWNGSIAPLWTKIHGKMTDAPHVTQADLDAKALEFGGVDSRLYRTMVLGEFPENDGDGLIPRWMVEKAVNNATAVPAIGTPHIWGVDAAGSGDNSDNSVLIKRQDTVVAEMPKTWRGLDPAQLSIAIRLEFERTPPEQRPEFICVDSNGLGEGLAGNLRMMGLPVRFVNVGTSPTRKPHFYSRLRDQLWWEAAEWFRNQNVSIPDHPDLIKELVTPTYTSDTGKIKIEKKDEMKKRLKGASPDYADALCLTFAISPTRYSSLSRAFDKFNNERDLRWLE
ncbi:hypothetical protein [Neorhizobium sp. T7_12]|uniref:hypothetical protein n=1 Tax=Neorhizobium sp. T7_12 TaxID=2093832 RepID=UPI000CF8EE49|nr:hypothetical protein [Neorhizobium sp. T7_12]